MTSKSQVAHFCDERRPNKFTESINVKHILKICETVSFSSGKLHHIFNCGGGMNYYDNMH